MGIGDWGWGLGIGDWAQSPIPNPQSPIPILNECEKFKKILIIKKIKFYLHKKINERHTDKNIKRYNNSRT